MKYICTVCGKVYTEGNYPILQSDSGIVGDGCCKVGSLIEEAAIMQIALQKGDITISEYIKYLRDENTN